MKSEFKKIIIGNIIRGVLSRGTYLRPYILASFFIFFASLLYAMPQNNSDSLNISGFSTHSSTISPSSSSVTLDGTLADSLSMAADSINVRTSKSGMDSIVYYSARDTIKFTIGKKKMDLRGDSKLDYKVQKLEAENITLDFGESTISARTGKDKNGNTIGFPKFNDSGEEFMGEVIVFNFKTKKGLIELGETQMSEGFYFGNKIKRVSEQELFVEDGYYTTCDHPHPHFYFGSPEMKIVAKDKVFLDPIIFYVEDMPIFAIPFGLFFPSKGGRQSGIIIPTFFFSKSRGVTFNDLGFYYAASDYWDTQITADLYSKGGYLMKNKTRWNINRRIVGNLDMSYGNTRYNPDDKYTEAYSINLNHKQDIDPSSKVNVRLNFKSQDFNRNTSWNMNDRLQQTIESYASYSKNFDNGANISMNYQRSQNIIDQSYSETLPNLTFSLPNWTPLRNIVSSSSPVSWLRDVSLRYSANASSRKEKKIQTLDAGDETERDSVIRTTRALISHNPSISISPKFGYFTVQPSVGVSVNNYFKRGTRYFNPKDSLVHETFENGFFTEYSYNYGLRIQTRLYGMADDNRPFLFFIKPSYFGVQAARHTWQPSISYKYNPDLSDESLGFYGSYIGADGRKVKYSKYQSVGGGIASSRKREILSYSDNHDLEIKIQPDDTTKAEPIKLLNITNSLSYDMAADSLNFSVLSMNFRAPSLGFIDFNGNASFGLYDDFRIKKQDGISDSITGNYNRLLIQEGKGIARVQSLSFFISTSFSSDGIKFGDNYEEEDENKEESDSVQAPSLGSRFTLRNQEGVNDFDYYGDRTPGYSALPWSWNASMHLRFSYNRLYSFSKINRSISFGANFSLNLTTTWRISSSINYDFINNNIQAPSVDISKDLHCWELRASWYPTGFARGFYLRFGIKAPQLQDLKIEKRGGRLY